MLKKEFTRLNWNMVRVWTCDSRTVYKKKKGKKLDSYSMHAFRSRGENTGVTGSVGSG